MTAQEKPPFDGVPLLTIDEESGKVPPARLTKPKTARDIYVRAREDDKDNASNRADMQSLLDGEAPYTEQELADAGASGMTNLNFRGTKGRLAKALIPYWRMIQSTDEMVQTPTTYGAEEDRAGWSQIMAEEISEAYRESEWFVYQTAKMMHRFVYEAVGIGFFRDKLDWRYRGAGLGQFFFPRMSDADESEHEIVCSVDEFGVAGKSGLYNKIANAPAGATDYHGWNVPAVKKAIAKASAAVPAWLDWETLTAEIKNGDLNVANQTQKIRCVHFYVQEFNGTVSHYIISETCYCNQESEEEFLYVCRGKYKNVRELLVCFFYGIGTNTKTHSLRGLGYEVYPFEQQFNRSMGAAIDAAMLASRPMFKSSDENGYAGAAYQTIGPCNILDPEFELVQFAPPDLQKSVYPVIEEMRKMRNEQTAGYSSDGVFDGDQRKTKYEIAAGLEQNAALSDVEQDFFYLPFQRLIQESIRRMTNRHLTPEDPGGREVADLKIRLTKRGVPLEAFYQIDIRRVKIVRAIGGGSAASKTLALDQIGDMYERMDDVGRANFDWDKTVDRVGSAAASRYFTKNGERRTTVDTQIAILQNAQLLEGLEIPVLPSDKHIAHAREHIRPLAEMFEAYELGQVEAKDAAVRFQFLYSHAAEHVAMAAGDPATMAEVATLNEQLQRIGEIISNGLKDARHESEEEGSETQGQGPSVEQQMRVEEARQNLDLARQKADAQRQIMIDAAATKRAIADADAAARIFRERRAADAKQEIAKSAAKKAPAKKAAKKAPKKK